VLSEIPLAWNHQLRVWRKLNRTKKTVVGGAEAPDPNDEYLLYQTLVAAWPYQIANRISPPDFDNRIRNYTLKAMREAKEKTSWARHNEPYESAVSNFIRCILQSREFMDVFLAFQSTVAHFGMLNSLSQTLLKLTVPGVPDIYQGNELWEFRLADPDNRHAVDFALRERALQRLLANKDECCEKPKGFVRELLEKPEDGQIKLYVIQQTLRLRNRNAELFRDGEYVPLRSTGEYAKHVVAFARIHESGEVIVAAPRLYAKLMNGEPRLPSGVDLWKDTRIHLSDRTGKKFHNAFTGKLVAAEVYQNSSLLTAAKLFDEFPVALLTA
jgi:(1->4)-alpha-D-glucan 1-alpha-D-glucosylmutase